jgi:hypothetical protein
MECHEITFYPVQFEWPSHRGAAAAEWRQLQVVLNAMREAIGQTLVHP